MLRVASVLAFATGLVMFFTPKKSISPPYGAMAYVNPATGFGVEHDWLQGTAYFVAFLVLACLCLGVAELVRVLADSRREPSE